MRAGDLVGTNGSDYFLKDLENCTVVFMETLSALKIVNLKNCRVFTGPVAGSVFVREVYDSRLHICARQLRIHDSKNTIWFTKTASPPIIEDCSDMSFTGFTVTYPQLVAQMAANGLDDPQLGWFNGVETYKQVKDFKWHRAQASPNWCLLPSRDTSNDALTEADFAKADAERKWAPPEVAVPFQLWNLLLPLPENTNEAATQIGKRGQHGEDSDDDEDEI